MAKKQAKHAILSASASKRWLACPPSARLEEYLPDQTSEYAKEGSEAHDLAEKRLIAHLAGKKSPVKRNKEMSEAVDSYVATVLEKHEEAKKRSPDAELLIEQKLDYSDWVPDGFGTGDAIIISDGVMEVIDLKYGKGVPVYAKDNSQMRLYGLGAYSSYEMLYDITEVHMTIVQPRLDNVSTEELTVAELLDWAENVREIAKVAHEGKGGYNAGDHCKFCKARDICRARAESYLGLEPLKHKGATLTEDEMPMVLAKLNGLIGWAESMKKYALQQVVDGKATYRGWKLVEGTSNRQVTDPDKLARELVDRRGVDPSKLWKHSLIGLGDLEKLVGKEDLIKVAGDLIIKPKGKPTLVLESDKRPAIGSAAGAVKDFS